MRLKAFLLALLLVVPTASRVQATGAPESPPPPAKKKKIVVVSPEKHVVVDGDGVFVEGEDGPEAFADLGDFENFPGFEFFEGGGYIGVRPLEMTPELRAFFGAPQDAGVFVGKVEDSSPAAKAGLEVGDIVTSSDGARVASTRDLLRSIRHKKEGDAVKIEIVRNRAAKTLTVSVAEREDSRVRVGDFGPGMRRFQRRHAVPPVPPVPPAAPMPPASPRLQQRIDDLEKRIDALEGRTPAPSPNP